VDGQNVAIEYRYADGKLERLPALAAELVRLTLDDPVTITARASIVTFAAKSACPPSMG
jgi:putative tryptophan/tyrosine transport system substrate-binding protein